MSNQTKRFDNSLQDIIQLEPNSQASAPRRRGHFDVLDRWQVNDRYIGIKARVDSDVFCESYRLPGQYTTLQLDEQTTIYLAIANFPDTRRVWEFLVDRNSEAGQLLKADEKSPTLTLSPAEGSGYPVGRADNNSVFFFTTGSGIASVKPVIEYWENHPETSPSAISIYYGESNPSDFAYTGLLNDWQNRDINIIRTVENQQNSDIGYQYVQHAFEDRKPSVEDAVVFMSGAAVMAEKMVEKLLENGVSSDQIFTNI